MFRDILERDGGVLERRGGDYSVLELSADDAEPLNVHRFRQLRFKQLKQKIRKN